MINPGDIRTRALRLWALALTLFTGCDGALQQPTFCVFSSRELGAGSADAFDCGLNNEAEELSRCPVQTAAGTAPVLEDGGGYFLRHDLPEGIQPIGALKIHIQTPCASEDVEATHVNGRVLLPRTAPKGAACAFSLTAVMANSELSCSVPAQAAAACDDLDVVCSSDPPAP